MIYYYHRLVDKEPMLRITTDSFDLQINVGMWFPNTKAKVIQLLKLMYEYDYKGELPEILEVLQEDLKSKATFQDRKVQSAKMFCKMLNSNIEQIRIFGGKL